MNISTKVIVIVSSLGLALSSVLNAQEVKDANAPANPKGEAMKAVIGPDAFGYMGYDEAEPECTSNWVDISGTGTFIIDGDDASAAVDLPGPAFNFYGTAYSTLAAATNGFLSTDLVNSGGDLSNDCPLPSVPSTGSGARIYPLHDDLNLISGAGVGLFFEHFADCPRASGTGRVEGCYIFQWNNAVHFGGVDQFSFQAILYTTTFGIAFQHGPGNPEAGSGSTTGIQNASATDSLLFACDTAGSIEANSAQCIYNPMFPAGLAAQNAASFEVSKVFSDGNPAEVEVTLSCFTGLPLIQSQTISESQSVNFIVESFADGELDCNVTETDVTGYSPSYNNGSVDSADSCEFDDVLIGQANFCTVTNTPDPVEVSVFKDWIIEGEGGDSIDAYYSLTLACRGVIEGGFTHGPSGIWRKSLYDGSYLGTSDEEFTANVVPDWDGGTPCWVLETVYDSGVEVTNGCGSNGNPGLLVELDGGDSCTVTNTVFFEGIPTLSQYGMAILAMLMLGVGFVGFRRFV